jgi:hypothetical protein
MENVKGDTGVNTTEKGLAFLRSQFKLRNRSGGLQQLGPLTDFLPLSQTDGMRGDVFLRGESTASLLTVGIEKTKCGRRRENARRG